MEKLLKIGRWMYGVIGLIGGMYVIYVMGYINGSNTTSQIWLEKTSKNVEEEA